MLCQFVEDANRKITDSKFHIYKAAFTLLSRLPFALGKI